MAKKDKLDKLDKQILSILMENSNTPFSEIAKMVFVSGGTVHVRVNNMKEMGFITGANLRVDISKLGYDICAFLGIFLEKSSFYQDVIRKLKAIPEVVNANYTTGNYGIFVKLYCKDTAHLKNVLADKIQKINGIQRTETFISLEESINRPLYLTEEEEKN